MLSFEDARQLVISQTKDARQHTSHPQSSASLMPWAMCLRRKFARDREYPPFDRSTRDGYAVRASEATAGASTPLRRRDQSRRHGYRATGPRHLHSNHDRRGGSSRRRRRRDDRIHASREAKRSPSIEPRNWVRTFRAPRQRSARRRPGAFARPAARFCGIGHCRASRRHQPALPQETARGHPFHWR